MSFRVSSSILVDSERNLKVFYAQSATYQKSLTIQAIISIAIIVSAIVLNNQPVKSKFIECKGDFWVAHGIPGQIFLTLQVVLIITSSLQAERVFYAAPKKAGFFDR